MISTADLILEMNGARFINKSEFSKCPANIYSKNNIQIHRLQLD